MTLVSAPGKVLVAGGYLVLDARYFGLVFAANARFYTLVKTITADGEAPLIRVRSPQFANAAWSYRIVLPPTGHDDAVMYANGMRIVQLNTGSNANPFVAFTLLYTLQVAMEVTGVDHVLAALQSGIEIVVLGDNDYYSHRSNGHAPTLEELRALPPFVALGCTLEEVHKTGLGSSAAMTTSLTAGVLLHLGACRTEMHENEARLTLGSLGLIHNVAQLAHCAAQGKVGSGFDVSASVWGSQLYRRFDPFLLQESMQPEVGRRILQEGELGVEKHPTALLPVLAASNPLWKPVPPSGVQSVPTAVEGLLDIAVGGTDGAVCPAALQLPPGIRMCLADVDAGSNTRALVGQVSAFKKNQPTWAEQLFSVISAANQYFADGLLRLHLAYAHDASVYIRDLTALAQIPSTEWDAHQKLLQSPIVSAFIDVRNAMRSIRAGMRELGVRADAPIEPMEMSRLLDATINGASGVLGGGVPGAGGYDALYVLYLDSTGYDACAPCSPHSGILAVWANYTALSVGPLLCGADAECAAHKVPPEHNADPALEQVLHTFARTQFGLRVEDPTAVHGLGPYTASLSQQR
ncbi:phosphomevalonate kinase [Malassezia vespertilionis]|uniref:phosphomevalonate kinase n=1 Tax=Malassezia vespertilionis TaxID=2020962 RepID=A0A2N1JEU0_9BASI|nr:phosphomevalonate kinase [Malassezia vespertilionis]PKI85045.1 Erg8p [Malassezia vespertilionis]WFD05505.1 phosphomevalonate kinase [Malassezia vespertilionis]